MLHLDVTDATAIAGFSGRFSDLSFINTGKGGRAYVDNVFYDPEPGVAAVGGFARLVAVRRRR